MIMNRQSGILLHITSLAGKEGVGTLRDGLEFIKALKSSGQHLWQVLPLNPTNHEGSPYQSPSVFAGNPTIISLESLVEAGDLPKKDYLKYLRQWRRFKKKYHLSSHYVDYGFLWRYKLGYDPKFRNLSASPLKNAFKNFIDKQDKKRFKLFQDFCDQEQGWLTTYSQFMAYKCLYGFKFSWQQWPKAYGSNLSYQHLKYINEAVYFFKYLQFVFDEQAKKLFNFASKSGITLIGDLAIYPGFDSADVWSNPHCYQLKENCRPRWVAAVPPDYFSKNGQLWGNPVYTWGRVGTDFLHRQIYDWWLKRIKRQLAYHHVLKLDHFRGLVAYGRTSPKAKTARHTTWILGPGDEFLNYISQHLPHPMPLIAEDLGYINEQVHYLRQKYHLPGMKIFLFAKYKSESDPYLPQNINQYSVYYTGTHDNETLVQKLHQKLKPKAKLRMLEFLNKSREELPNWQAVDLISGSHAGWVIFPIQDILGLGKEARMNIPSSPSGSWRFRLTNKQMDIYNKNIGRHLKKITDRHHRL